MVQVDKTFQVQLIPSIKWLFIKKRNSCSCIFLLKRQELHSFTLNKFLVWLKISIRLGSYLYLRDDLHYCYTKGVIITLQDN